MRRDGPGFLALADEVQLALAGGQTNVGEVQGGDLGDAGAAYSGSSAMTRSRVTGQASTARRYRSLARGASAFGACRGPGGA